MGFIYLLLPCLDEQTLKETINKWDPLKLRNFYKAKDTVNKTKWHPTDWENSFTNSTLDRRLISKIYKELKKFDIKRTNNPMKKWGTDLKRELSTDKSQRAERHLRR